MKEINHWTSSTSLDNEEKETHPLGHPPRSFVAGAVAKVLINQFRNLNKEMINIQGVQKNVLIEQNHNQN